MPISFKCPQCDKQYQLKDDMAGKQARCSCGAVLKIPQPGAAAGGLDPPGDAGLGNLLDDALSGAPQGGALGGADSGGGAIGAGGGSAPNPFGAQTPGAGSSGGASSNPYMAPTSPYQFGAPTTQRRAALGKLPTFCLVMFIIDTVFCCLRMGVGCFGVVGLAAAGGGAAPGVQLGTLDYMGVVFNLAIAVFGLIANTLLFMKKPFAPYIAFVALFFVLCTIVVGMLNLSQVGANLPMGGGPPNQQAAQQVGFVIGVGCALVIPLIINGLYIAALVKFMKWVKG